MEPTAAAFRFTSALLAQDSASRLEGERVPAPAPYFSRISPTLEQTQRYEPETVL
jgi:hypothetical protein